MHTIASCHILQQALSPYTKFLTSGIIGVPTLWAIYFYLFIFTPTLFPKVAHSSIHHSPCLHFILPTTLWIRLDWACIIGPRTASKFPWQNSALNLGPQSNTNHCIPRPIYISTNLIDQNKRFSMSTESKGTEEIRSFGQNYWCIKLGRIPGSINIDSVDQWKGLCLKVSTIFDACSQSSLQSNGVAVSQSPLAGFWILMMDVCVSVGGWRWGRFMVCKSFASKSFVGRFLIFNVWQISGF